MMNRLDGQVEDYPVRTLITLLLTQHVVRTIGHHRLLRIRFCLVMLQPSFISALKALRLGS
jgi:hypothetical protein